MLGGPGIPVKLAPLQKNVAGPQLQVQIHLSIYLPTNDLSIPFFSL